MSITRFDLVGKHISHNDHLVFELSEDLIVQDSIILVDLPTRCETNCIHSDVFRLEVNGYSYHRLLDFYNQLEEYIAHLNEDRRVYAQFINGDYTATFEVIHPRDNVKKSVLLYSFANSSGLSNNYAFDVNYYILDAISDMLYELIHNRNQSE